MAKVIAKGALLMALMGRHRKVPLRWTIHLTAPALAAAYALGRAGCFMVGDDYGRPTTSALGVRFPEGLPPSTAGSMESMFGIGVPPGTDPATVLAVHPTQLYEVVAMLLVFELTDNYSIILPLMLATVTSSVVATRMLPDSMYTLKLARKGSRTARGRNLSILERIPVRSVLTTSFDRVAPETPLPGIIRLIQQSRNNTFPVVASNDRLVGMLSFQDLRTVLFDQHLHALLIAGDIANEVVTTVTDADTLADALSKMEGADYEILPVTAASDPARLVGVIRREDLLHHYQRAILFETTKVAP